MKASFYTESILYWLARGVSALAQRIPPQGNAMLGRVAGTFLYHLTASRRAVAMSNLRAAFGDAYSPRDYRRILRGLYRNLGVTLLEVAAIPRIDRAYVDRWVTLSPETRDRLEAARAQGKGVILLAGHFGSWELIPITGALVGYPSLLLAREQGWPRLNRLLTDYRESKGCQVVTKGFAVRDLIHGLREGKVVGILADQDAGGRGVLAPFFGRLASTAGGTVELSLRTGAPILPVFIVRRGGSAHDLIAEKPLAIPSSGTEKERIQAGVAAYLSVLERYIRNHPDHWFWLHRRWKSTPERRILIFSDGKAGHRNQSVALAERLERAWMEKMKSDRRLEKISRPLATYREAQIRFRSRAGRFLLTGVASLAPRRFQGGEFWLRLCLAPESYRAIASAHADIAVSCGAGMAPVNLLWSWMIRARPVHITRTRFPSWRKFDLSVLPRHDLGARVPRRSGLLVTDGALVPAGSLNSGQAKRWKKRLGLSGGKQVGLLLGGPSAKGEPLKRQEMEEAVRSLVSSAQKLDAQLLVTTSRRTPSEWEEWLTHQLEGNRRCRLLTLVNQGRTGGLAETREAVPCILGLSDALVVSGDSISMVSEAVSAGKPVIAFSPPPGSKYERFLKQMHVGGRLQWVEPADVGGAVSDALKRPAPPAAAFHSPDPAVEFLKRWL